MNCVNCGAPLPPKTTRCPFCQTLNDVDLRGRVTVRRGTTSRDCPRCREKLTAVLLRVGGEEIELDRCETCHGLFFDPGELDGVLDGIEHRAETVDHRQLVKLVEEETPGRDFEQVTYVPCPVCGTLMNRRAAGLRSGVVLDECREHGLWLDGGELRRLIRWTQAGGRRHHAAQQAGKERLELPRRPAPSADSPRSPLLGRSAGGTGPWWDAGSPFDVLDLVGALGSLVGWRR